MTHGARSDKAKLHRNTPLDSMVDVSVRFPHRLARFSPLTHLWRDHALVRMLAEAGTAVNNRVQMRS
jgi:hypothetical protein